MSGITEGPLTSLESISKVSDWLVAKMGKLSIFLTLFFSVSQASTIMAEAITNV